MVTDRHVRWTRSSGCFHCCVFMKFYHSVLVVRRTCCNTCPEFFENFRTLSFLTLEEFNCTVFIRRHCYNAQRNLTVRKVMPASVLLPIVCMRLLQQPRTQLCLIRTPTAIQLQNRRHLYRQLSLQTNIRLMRQQRRQGFERRVAISVSTAWQQTAANATHVGQCRHCCLVFDCWTLVRTTDLGSGYNVLDEDRGLHPPGTGLFGLVCVMYVSVLCTDLIGWFV